MVVITAMMLKVAWCFDYSLTFADHHFMYDNLFFIFQFEESSLSWKQQQQQDNMPASLFSSPFTTKQLLPEEGQNPSLPLLFTSLPPVALIQSPDLPLNFCIRPLQINCLEEVPFLLWFILFVLKWRQPLSKVRAALKISQPLEAQGQINLCNLPTIAGWLPV